MRNPKDRLTDMLEAIDNIERYAGRGRVAFEQDELIQNWFIHHIQIIGEVAAKIDRSFQLDHPQISWAQIIAMRNTWCMIISASTLKRFGVSSSEIYQN